MGCFDQIVKKTLSNRFFLLALLVLSTVHAIGDSNLPFTAEENADGARFVWYVLNRSDMKFDYLSADHFSESPISVQEIGEMTRFALNLPCRRNWVFRF